MDSKKDIKDWDNIAEAYSQNVEDGNTRSEITEPLLERIGDAKGLSILDLGCGQGWLSKNLSDQRARVVGIDGSSRLIDRARELYPGIEFQVFDLANGLPQLKGWFDLAMASMMVMDIPELDKLFGDVYKALKPGGRFLMSLPHPCFFNHKSRQDETGKWYKKITGYLVPETWRIETFGGHNHYHRSLSTYINLLNDAGLRVSWLSEPPHISQTKDQEWKGFLKTFPVFMLLEAIKS